jgi:ABC-type lipoprotein release transport system permease subunit
MGMYLQLAWRNLWRNRNRTLITTASIFFAIVLVLFTRSMQLGTYRHIIRNTVRQSTGYLQIQDRQFWQQRSLDNSLQASAALRRQVDTLPHVTQVLPRLESFALASSGAQSRGVQVEGIDPAAENRLSGLSSHLQRGAYLRPDSSGALVSAKLAEHLGLQIGDTLVLLGQGYHGVSAAGAFPVVGIIALPIPELDSRTVYLSLTQAQWLFAAPERLTALAVMIDDPRNLTSVKDRLSGMLPAGLTVMDWREMMPELVQSIEFDNAGGLIMLAILYVVIAFGVFGTVMMMVAERRREFAILLSVGMKRWRMSLMVLLETIGIGLIGTASGLLASIPLLGYVHGHPVHISGKAAQAMLQYGFEPLMAFSLEPGLFLHQALVVLLLTLLAAAPVKAPFS